MSDEEACAVVAPGNSAPGIVALLVNHHRKRVTLPKLMKRYMGSAAASHHKKFLWTSFGLEADYNDVKDRVEELAREAGYNEVPECVHRALFLDLWWPFCHVTVLTALLPMGHDERAEQFIRSISSLFDTL